MVGSSMWSEIDVGSGGKSFISQSLCSTPAIYHCFPPPSATEIFLAGRQSFELYHARVKGKQRAVLQRGKVFYNKTDVVNSALHFKSCFHMFWNH